MTLLLLQYVHITATITRSVSAYQHLVFIFVYLVKKVCVINPDTLMLSIVARKLKAGGKAEKSLYRPNILLISPEQDMSKHASSSSCSLLWSLMICVSM